jgi:hypothetical protein
MSMTPETLAFRRRSCERKRWFLRRSDAELEMTKRLRPAYAYHCQFCEGWHIAIKKENADTQP